MAADGKVPEGSESTKSSTARKKRTIDCPHEFCSGAPTLELDKLELTDFVSGFLAMIKPYARKEVMLQLLELLMLKASSYTWKSVRSFYAHLAKQVELCRLECYPKNLRRHVNFERKDLGRVAKSFTLCR